MRRTWLISRRTALQGLGVAIGLPLLESMGWADPPRGGAAQRPPIRLGFINVPNGVNQAEWWPKDEASFVQSGPLPRTIEPLRPLLGDVLMLGGIDSLMAIDPKVGNASHAREVSAWLTGFRCKEKAVECAISADQLAAQRLGAYTALPSIELALSPLRAAGDCMEGFSCAYFHISWRSPSQPMPVEIDPRAVYNRLFAARTAHPARRGGLAPAAAPAAGGENGPPAAEVRSLDQSMVDLVLEHARTLRARVSGKDQRKLDEFLDSTRALETRISAIERQAAERARAGAGGEARHPYRTSPLIEVKPPGAIPERLDEHARIMFDLVALAFQTDTTRIFSLVIDNAFVSRSYPELGVEQHHVLSHHDNDPAKLAALAKINRYHVEQLAYFLTRLKGLSEGRETLLDSCAILFGSGLSEGFTHNPRALPTIIAGKAGGTIRSGRFVKAAKGNQCDLLMGLLARAGCPLDAFGDGTRMLADLA